MESLKRKRANVKGSITRIEKWFEQNIDLIGDYEQFETRLQALSEAYKKFCELQDSIEELDNVAEIEERGSCEDRYYSLSGLLQTKINSLKNNNVKNVTASTNASQSSNITRPQLSIPVFSGDITAWHCFYELYKNFIENDSSLTKIEKLIYLKSYLKGEALSLICNLQLSSDNFDIALKTLKDRYDNEINIIYAHIKNLIDAPSMSKNKIFSLRDLVTLLKQNMEGLKNLRVNVDQWDLILIYIFSQKLDPYTRKAFDYELGTNSRPTLTLFFEFLEKRCIIFERSAIPDLGIDTKAPKISHRVHLSHNNSETFMGNSLQGNTQPNVSKCVYCNLADHKIYKCQKFCSLPRPEKYNFIKQKKLCYNCLTPNHVTNDCTSHGCQICTYKHHSLLHPELNQQQSRNNQPPLGASNNAPDTHPNLNNNHSNQKPAFYNNHRHDSLSQRPPRQGQGRYTYNNNL